MVNVHTGQTTQTIGRINFVVTSNFKAKGHSVEDKLSTLVRREAEIKSANRLDNALGVRYTPRANAV